MSDDENDKLRNQNRQALIANARRTAVGAKAELARLLERVAEITNGWIDSEVQKVEAVLETAEQRDRLRKEAERYAERFRGAEVRNEALQGQCSRVNQALDDVGWSDRSKPWWDRIRELGAELEAMTKNCDDHQDECIKLRAAAAKVVAERDTWATGARQVSEGNADLRDKVARLEKQLSEMTRSRDSAADDLRFLHSALINMDERAIRSFSGGYRTESELEAFRHGMTTICNAVRGTFGDMVVRRYAAAVDAAPGTPSPAAPTSLVVEDRSAEPRTSGDEPDPAHVYVDPSGTVWYRYTVEFVDHGLTGSRAGAGRYDFELWAINGVDAQRRLDCIRQNARLAGQVFKRGSTIADVTEPNRRRGTS